MALSQIRYIRYFNSSKVRLKGTELAIKHKAHEYFNSSKVRLKGELSEIDDEILTKFQFL